MDLLDERGVNVGDERVKIGSRLELEALSSEVEYGAHRGLRQIDLLGTATGVFSLPSISMIGE